MNVELNRGTGRVLAVIVADSGTSLPERYGPWTTLKTLSLERGQQQPGLDVEQYLNDLERYGIHVTDAHVRITEQALS